MKPGRYSFFTLLSIVFLSSCLHQAGPPPLFTEIPSSLSNIHFSNDIKEDENYNILTYEYLYNGGGVATGDVNNDGLPDIFLTGNMVPNKLYLNKGNFVFEDITAQSGIKDRAKWKTGAVMADINGDGLLDIYVCYSGPGTDAERANELFINNGMHNGLPSFTESAKQYGLDAPGTFTTTVSFFDMDNDGDLDMLMVNHADMFFNPFYNSDKLRATRHPKFGNRLYRNDNGHFTDISEQAHIDGSGLNFGLSVSISDINNDGWADIYVTNDYDERDFLYLNNHDGSFREVLTKATGHISEFAMGSDIADFNNDNRPDVMVLDMLPEDNHRQKLLKGADAYDKYTMRTNAGFHKQQMRNTLQLNNGNDSSGIPLFSEAGQLAGVSNTDWSWAPLFADFDNDGWKDLFISNGIFKDITNLDFVKYTSGYSANYITPEGNKEEMWKLIQQMPSTKLNNYLFRNNHDLTFSNLTKEWGFTANGVSNGSAYADLDNDGDLDLIINRLDAAPGIYKNNTTETTHAHFIKIRLRGNDKNSFGIGAKVFVTTAHTNQLQEEYTSRGFQSSVDPVMHIGLGKDSLISTLKVIWSGGKTAVLKNIKADTLLLIEEKKAGDSVLPEKNEQQQIAFREITQHTGIDYTHHPAAFVDFKISPLLPYQVSRIGPVIAKADVNRDGLEDLFIGASSAENSVLYLQTQDGRFVQSASQPWNEGQHITVADALFFDADNDGDADLYVVSGGADFNINNPNYQDRFFENDGKGNYKKLDNTLPAETLSGSCVRAADINRDGLTDLFVGGKLNPGFYPEAPENFILKNRSTPGHILFEKDMQQTDTVLKKPGMVTDAVWMDLNKDGWQDLVVVGEFMPVTIFENHAGILKDATKEYGLSETNGWWCRILAEDMDNDGDTDLVIGNLGLNTQFKASAAAPLSITYGDFYGNGTIDPILCYYNGSKSYPFYSKDEIADQVPSLQKKFLHYKDFADAGLKDMFSEAQLAASHTVKIKMLQSVVLRNDGAKKFTVIPLPQPAQISAVNGIIPADIDGDGKKDIIIAGNFYPFRVQIGPLDAGAGLVLKGNGKCGFSSLDYAETNLYLPGDTRNLISLKGKNRLFIVAAVNNGPLRVFEQVRK